MNAKSAVLPIFVVLVIWGTLTGVAFLGWREEWLLSRLRSHGQDTEATVTASNPRARKFAAKLNYEFTTGDQIVSASADVSAPTQRDILVGAPIRIRFLPDHDNFSRPVGIELTSRPRTIMRVGYLLCSVYAVAFPIAALYDLIQRRKKKAINVA